MNSKFRPKTINGVTGAKPLPKVTPKLLVEIDKAHTQLLCCIKKQGVSCVTDATQSRPGSPQKIAILIERCKRKIDLFLPEDRLVFAEKCWVNEE